MLSLGFQSKEAKVKRCLFTVHIILLQFDKTEHFLDDCTCPSSRLDPSNKFDFQGQVESVKRSRIVTLEKHLSEDLNQSTGDVLLK